MTAALFGGLNEGPRQVEIRSDILPRNAPSERPAQNCSRNDHHYDRHNLTDVEHLPDRPSMRLAISQYRELLA
jgi:hypothetical protein